MLDTSILIHVLESVAAAFIGALALRTIERRPRLVAFYGHVGAFQLQPSANGPRGSVHTHSVVIRNSGKIASHNVRVPHSINLAAHLVNISVEPQTAYSQTTLPAGGDELLFPVIAPSQQVTISYLYYPPLTWNAINQQIRSDEGMARVINVLPTPQLPKWQQIILWILIVMGFVSLVYFLVIFARWAASAF